MNRRSVDTGNNAVDKLQEKMAALKLQLEAQIVKCSHLQARLSSALDAMETLQYTHAREIAAERETKALLNTKVNGLAEYVQKVEEERDELREVVLALVEKVEVSNDYSLWPYSRVRLPHTIEPLQDPSASAIDTFMRSSTEAHDFGPFIVAALRTELEKERASHVKTHDSAEFEIACLRSQLARRDAELQACIVHADHAALLQEMHGLPSPKLPVKQHAPPDFAPEETARTLRLATAANRELEIENMELVSRIGKSRSKVKHPTHDNARFRAQPSTSGSRGEGLPGSHIPSHVIARLPSPSPPSPNLPPNSRHDSPSPYTMTPRIPGTPDRAHNVQLNREDVTQSQPSRSTLADLGEEVQKLGDQIELLHQQRAKWHEHLLLDSEETTSTGTAIGSSYKEEAVQAAAIDVGTAELVALRIELEAFKQKATQREAGFTAEILKLRYALADRHAEFASPGETDTLVALISPLTSKHKQGPDHQASCPSDETAANVTVLVLPSITEPSLADHTDTRWESGTGTEQSMELGTPLRPSVILNDGDTIIMTNAPAVSSPPALIDLAHINPLLVPLPDSPVSSPRARVRACTPLPTDDVRSAAIRDRPPTPFKFASPARGQIDGADDTEASCCGSAPPAIIVPADVGVESEADTNERVQGAGENLGTTLQDIFAGD